MDRIAAGWKAEDLAQDAKEMVRRKCEEEKAELKRQLADRNVAVEEAEEVLADLKRQLEELTTERDYYREQYRDANSDLRDLHAHAEALAGALEEIMQAREAWEAQRNQAYENTDFPVWVQDEVGESYQRCMDDVLRAVAVNHPEAESALTAYRNREE